MPVVSDAVAARRADVAGFGQIECDLGGAAPQTGPGISVQVIAGDTNDALDQGLPIASGRGAGRGRRPIGGDAP